MTFTTAHTDPLHHADAVVVLAGEHDGREDYGISLAASGWAHTVVLSDPYPDSDPIMRRVCRQQVAGVEVRCPHPAPITTRGEAEMVHSLAAQRSWTRVIVVSWRYHLPRARLVFGQCFSRRPGAVMMEAVPQRYNYSVVWWEYIYAYQYGALAKTVLLGDCIDQRI